MKKKLRWSKTDKAFAKYIGRSHKKYGKPPYDLSQKKEKEIFDSLPTKDKKLILNY